MDNVGYTQADWDEVSDNPELTEEQLAQARPFAEVFPDLAATPRLPARDGTAAKIRTAVRLSPEVIAHFRATGRGWRGRIDDALKSWIAAR